MMKFSLLFIFIILHSLADAWWFGKKKDWPVKAVGKITCDGHPMPYIYVKLMDKDFIFHDTMGTTRTNANGQFTVNGKGRDGRRGKPDPFIRIHYSYAGVYGKMRIIKKPLGIKITRKGETGVRGYSSYINFGTINFASIHCRAYNQFYKALKDFKTKTNHQLPYKCLNVITRALIHGGTPYATTDTVRIPKKYTTISFTTAKHEFAHTIRQSMDGTFGHFLLDVIKYKYTQHHSCNKRTNNGFAFNEGWAEYWAGSCYGNYGSPTSYNIEGNVAKALRKLQQTCSTSDYKMIRVLAHRKKYIHSFSQFNYVHKKLYKCSL